MTRTYTFDLACPNCGRETEATGTREVPPPKLNCGECLMDHAEIIELKPIRVWVNNGERT